MVRRLVILIIFLAPFLSWRFGRPQPQLTMFDVGQGLSVLVEDETGWQLLFDGGPDNSVLAQLGTTLAPTDDYIDVVVISHQHRDHYVGLIEVLRRYRVGELWLTRADSKDPAWQELLAVAKQKQIPLLEIKEGMLRYLASGRVIRGYHPPANPRGDEAHDYAVVLTVEHLTTEDSPLGPSKFKTDLVLTGDAEARHEQYIGHCQISRVLPCPTTGAILQAGHHGSKTSTSEPWLKLLQPNVVLISAGQDNSYGHPHQEVLERLERLKINYRRTDLNGTIKIPL
ncbi:MAG: MBL fold metallo-hydrolase [bacterium]|nr:MBL fold metallo-hydrolase [bacterium]